MKELHTDIEIEAGPARVWEILTDFASYPDWNPFIRSIEGEPREGARLEARIEPPGGRAMTFKPTVLTATPERELRWLGRLVAPRVFDGEHRFEIHENEPGRVTFVQHEEFRGVLVPFVRSMIEGTTLSMLERVNADLAVRVRSQAAA